MSETDEDKYEDKIFVAPTPFVEGDEVKLSPAGIRSWLECIDFYFSDLPTFGRVVEVDEDGWPLVLWDDYHGTTIPETTHPYDLCLA